MKAFKEAMDAGPAANSGGRPVKIGITSDADLSEQMLNEVGRAEAAVTRAITATGNKIKMAWRDDVRRALGQKMSNAIRGKVYPEGKPSLNAAAFVFARPSRTDRGGAAAIIDGHERGVTIRSSAGRFLAIPTEEATRGRRAKSTLSPDEWEKRTGNKLHLVTTRTGKRFLVASVKTTKTGRFGRGRMTKGGAYAKGTFTSVMFVLIPQAKLRKRLDLMNKADRLALALPDAIVRNWPR